MIPAIVIASLGAFFGFANPLARFPALILLVPAAQAYIGASAQTPKSAFRGGYLCGAATASLVLYWIAIPLHDFGSMPWVLAAPCPVLVSLVIALYPALFSLGVHLALKRASPLAAGLLAGLMWASLELGRGVLLTGFPWLTLAAAFVPWPAFTAPASLIGAYLLSGVYASAASLLAFGLGLGRVRRDTAALIAGGCILALTVAVGTAVLSGRGKTAETASISVIQGNVDQSQKWDRHFQDEIVGRYVRLSSEEIAANRPSLVIWPETSLPFFFEPGSLDDHLSRSVKKLVKDSGTPLLVGAPAEGTLGGRRVLYNRAYLISPPNATERHYDKEHLVPFGEYIPLEAVFGFMGQLFEGVGDFVPGSDTGPIASGKLALGLLVCYEGIFPELAQSRAASGANVLVSISNDAWYGRSSAPEQHLELTALRAVEQGMWLVRCTNTGISAAVDPAGRVTFPTALFEPARANYPHVGLADGHTFFHRWFFAVTALAASGAAVFILLVLAERRGRKQAG